MGRPLTAEQQGHQDALDALAQKAAVLELLLDHAIDCEEGEKVIKDIKKRINKVLREMARVARKLRRPV